MASFSSYLAYSAWHVSLSFLSSFAAIYSGDYKWFESESEAESEGESATGSPTHDRSHSPTEAERGRGVAEETGDKGMSLVYWKREKKEERRKVTRKKAYFSETSRFKINFNPEKITKFKKASYDIIYEVWKTFEIWLDLAQHTAMTISLTRPLH